MLFLGFLFFFCFNFTLFFMLPVFGLKYFTKVGRKKKDNNFIMDIVIYMILTLFYIFINLSLYRYFNIVLDELKPSLIDNIYYINKDQYIIGILLILYLIISVVYTVFTYMISKKNFRLKKLNLGYLYSCITGFFTIISYFVLNSILNLDFYSFTTDYYFFDIIMTIDYKFLLFLYVTIVLGDFAFSFIRE